MCVCNPLSCIVSFHSSLRKNFSVKSISISEKCFCCIISYANEVNQLNHRCFFVYKKRKLEIWDANEA